MAKVCINCGYERQATDTAPEYECPKCQIVYAKAEKRRQIESEIKYNRELSSQSFKTRHKSIFDSRTILKTIVTLAILSPIGYFNYYFEVIDKNKNIANTASHIEKIKAIKQNQLPKVPDIEQTKIKQPQSPITSHIEKKRLKEQVLPQHGSAIKYISRGIAPLNIRTAGNAYHHVIKIVQWWTKISIGEYFIRSGKGLAIKVPLGSYEIRYASGVSWYGWKNLFGHKTIYNRADKKFTFTRNGNRINGYTIELILQQGGNLSSSEIMKTEW